MMPRLSTHAPAWLPRVWRWGRYSLGTVEAIGLALLGWWLWANAPDLAVEAARAVRIDAQKLATSLGLAALGLFSAGQFVFVFIVANDVCRRVPISIAAGFQWLTGAFALAALAVAAVMAWGLFG
jgi:hypothetical protein